MPALDAGLRGRLTGYRARIGVNNAVEHAACDWWVFGDWQTFTYFSPVGFSAPRLFLGECVVREIPGCGQNKRRAEDPGPGGKLSGWLTAHGSQLAADGTSGGGAGGGWEIHDWRDVLHRPIPGAEPDWQTYSSTAALVLAVNLAMMRSPSRPPDAIDVYGADMAGDTDCSGRTSGGRDADRWKLETSIWEPTVAWARSLGVCIRRFQGYTA